MNEDSQEFSNLPVGRAPAPVSAPHFPDALHAVVWRNWEVVPLEDLARVLKGTPRQIADLARSMGLPEQRPIAQAELRRNYMTLLHRNWHLLPYEQLCGLLGWDAAHMQFSLNEDDFMFIKLGGYKPKCPPVYYKEPDAATRAAVAEIAQVVREEFGDAISAEAEPLYGFINRFRKDAPRAEFPADPKLKLRMVYPYFLRFGDPLVGEGIEDIPDSYLAELAAEGVNAIWLQGILNKLAPWDLEPELSCGWEERLSNLNLLVERCRQFDIDVLLYLNEPRGMPRSFFEKHPELRGVEETPERAEYSPDVVALCVSTPAVQEFLVNSVRHVFERVPGLGGIMTITFSENLTNCWSREYDTNATDAFATQRAPGEAGTMRTRKACPRCATRGPEAVHADVCALLEKGMRLAGSKGHLLFYAWSTPERWIPKIIEQLPESVWVLCVSEWGVPFTRAGYSGNVNEYSISVVGPSDQSRRQWALARHRGLRTAVKIQAANTWEISSLPYIPALRLVAEHLSNLTEEGVDGIMLGWTSGGSPSPNLDLVAEFAGKKRPEINDALTAVALKRYGKEAAPDVVRAWHLLSDAFQEFPFDIAVCYNAPQSLGPANQLFAEPTGYPAAMVTFPFDDLQGWRGPYSEETFQTQFEKLAEKWKSGVEILETLRTAHPSEAIEDEWRIAEAARINFRSTANQIRYIRVRQSNPKAAAAILKDEIELARKLHDLVAQDSRLGFEATNQYAYIRLDLVEKVLNCRQILKTMGSSAS